MENAIQEISSALDSAEKDQKHLRVREQKHRDSK
jgi:hypothetical protein